MTLLIKIKCWNVHSHIENLGRQYCLTKYPLKKTRLQLLPQTRLALNNKEVRNVLSTHSISCKRNSIVLKSNQNFQTRRQAKEQLMAINSYWSFWKVYLKVLKIKSVFKEWPHKNKRLLKLESSYQGP